MNYWHERPTLAFDTETTGTDPDEARIVSYAIAHMTNGADTPSTLAGIVNPGIDIPEGASNVHGITTEKAVAEGEAPRDALETIHHALDAALTEGRTVTIFNAAYDMSVLFNEAERYGDHALKRLLPKLLIVDPLVIDKQHDKYRRGSRQLAIMCQHYGITGMQWHTSEADALAAGRLAYTLAGALPPLRRLTPEQLHQGQIGWRAEQSASLQDYFRNKRNPPDPEAVIDGGWPFQGVAARQLAL